MTLFIFKRHSFYTIIRAQLTEKQWSLIKAIYVVRRTASKRNMRKEKSENERKEKHPRRRGYSKVRTVGNIKAVPKIAEIPTWFYGRNRIGGYSLIE